MRITNNMMVANTVRNLNSNLERLSKAQEQVSSENKIQLPSDDPIVATRAIKYRSYVAKVEQYQTNVENAQSWQKTTDSALSDLNDVVENLRELVNQASNDTLSDTDRADIKTQVEELEQSAIDCLNTSYAGRYIFGGYATSEEPYTTETNALGTKVTYKDQYLSTGIIDASVNDSDIQSFYTTSTNVDKVYDSGTADQAIKYNIGFGSDIAVNVEGQDVTGTGLTNLFDTFSKVLLGLDGDTSYKTATINSDGSVTVNTNDFTLSDLLGDIDDNLNTIATAQADLGARMNYVNMVSDRLSTASTNYKELMSDNENVDITEAYTEEETASSVYDASLSVGAKVITKTLVDYIS